MDDIHHLKIRVYHEDTDFSGLVYHGAYVRFCERGRSEMVRAQGGSQRQMRQDSIFYVVRKMSFQFLKPARYDDLLEVRTFVKEKRGASLIIDQQIWRGDEHLIRAEVQVVCIDADGRPMRL